MKNSNSFPFIIAVISIISLFAYSGYAGPKLRNKAKAKKLFDKAMLAMEKYEYQEALTAFEGAYENSPHWAVLTHIGTCAAKLNQPVKSIKSFEKYLAEADPQKNEKGIDLAQEMLAKQYKKVGRLHLKAKPYGTEVKIDDISIGKSPFTGVILVKAGPRHLLGIYKDTIGELDIEIRAGQDRYVKWNIVKEDEKPVPTPVVAPVVTPSPKAATPPAPPKVAIHKKPIPKKTVAVVPIKKRPVKAKVQVKKPVQRVKPAVKTVAAVPTAPPKPKLGLLVVTSNIDRANVFINQKPAGSTPIEKLVPTGQYNISIEKEGFASFEKSVFVRNNMKSDVKVSMADNTVKPKHLSVPFWIAASISGAGLITGATGLGFFIYNKKSEENYTDAIDKHLAANPSIDVNNVTCPSNDNVIKYYCDNEFYRGEYEDNKRKSLIPTILGTSIFVVGGVTAALLYAFPEWFLGAKSRSTISITPLADSSQSGLILHGTF